MCKWQSATKYCYQSFNDYVIVACWKNVAENSKAKDHTESLKRRLKLWKEGDFDGLGR